MCTDLPTNISESIWTYTFQNIAIDICLAAQYHRLVRKPLKSDSWYTAREASSLLNDEVTEATIKEYCKRGELAAKKVGPRKRWMISGVAIQKLRKKWGIQ